MTIYRVSTSGTALESGEGSRGDNQLLNPVSDIANAAPPAQDAAFLNLLDFINQPPPIAAIVMEYASSLSIAQGAKPELRKQFFANLQENYRKNFLLQTSGCLSVSPDPKTFCIETAEKVRQMAAHLDIFKDRVADTDSLDLMPILEMMQPHIDHSLCVVFNHIAEELPAGSSARELGNIANKATRAKEIRSWMDDPQNADALKQVKRLYLTQQALRFLPPEIEKCASLVYLDLSKNELESLPDTIGNLSKLKTLYLSNNKLRALPSTISNLHKLNELSLAGNKLQRVPATLENLKTLDWLYLSDNNLQEVPDRIGHLYRQVPTKRCWSQLKRGDLLYTNTPPCKDASIF